MGAAIANMPIIGKYTRRKREFNEVGYDTTLPVLTAEGWVADENLKRRCRHARRTRKRRSVGRFCQALDYSILKKIYRELKPPAESLRRNRTAYMSNLSGPFTG